MALWIFRLTAYSISKRFPDKIFKIKKIRVNIHTVLRYLHGFFIGINSFKLFSEFIFSFSVTGYWFNNLGVPIELFTVPVLSEPREYEAAEYWRYEFGAELGDF